jgi:hypothetical protein
VIGWPPAARGRGRPSERARQTRAVCAHHAGRQPVSASCQACGPGELLGQPRSARSAGGLRLDLIEVGCDHGTAVSGARPFSGRRHRRGFYGPPPGCRACRWDRRPRLRWPASARPQPLRIRRSWIDDEASRASSLRFYDLTTPFTGADIRRATSHASTAMAPAFAKRDPRLAAWMSP